MKKLVKAVLASTMMFTMVGCGSNTPQDKLEQIKEEGKIVLGTSPDFPPMEFYALDEKGNKQIVGSDISLAQAIADEIGVKLEIKATDFNGVLANTQSGSIDMAISGFSQTEERKQVMQFSDGYYREAEGGFQGILTTKENAAKYKSLDELKKANLKIAAQAGSIQYEMAMKITDAANIKQYGTTDAAALALDSGDIDAIVVSTSQAEPMLKTFPDLTILPKDGFNLDPEDMYATNVIGFPLGDEYKSLIDLCNKVIKEAKDTGKMNQWLQESKELSLQAVEG